MYRQLYHSFFFAQNSFFAQKSILTKKKFLTKNLFDNFFDTIGINLVMIMLLVGVTKDDEVLKSTLSYHSYS